MKKSIRGLSILILFNLYACGKGEQELAANGIVGSIWSGNFQAALPQGGFSEPKQIQLDFRTDETFHMAADTATSVAGTYTDFQEMKEVTMKIKESNFDLFGKSGQSKNFNYNLAGDELKLDGDGGRYLLKRQGSSDSEASEDAPLDGHWGCRPDDGSVWTIVIAKTSFRASKSVGGNKPLYFEGTVAMFDQATGDLKITSSTREDLIGLTLRTFLQTDGSIKVHPLNGSVPDPNIKPIDCTEQ